VTHLIEDEKSFVDDALAGLTAVHPDLLRLVDGGVVRIDTDPGKVAVVIGGGSGHYPAFAGYVGPGLAAAAVVGQVFASPSTAQILRVCDALGAEAGVLFVFGNYAGDVLNFEAAAAVLRERGSTADCLAVTDDVASAPAEQTDRRRGVAGDVPVMKVVGAAAEAGLPFAEVLRLGRLANDRTRSFGLAFSGATMPGHATPMFTVPAGSMGVGLGIHGEPGIGEEPLPSASRIAALLVDAVWSERPPGAPAEIAVLLNSLGATSQEELFALWHYVSGELAARGADVVEPLVGPYVTSLDMAGCSLTVTWLDDELETRWRAPAESVALHRGAVDRETVRARSGSTAATPGGATPELRAERPVEAATASSRALAAHLQESFALVAAGLGHAEDELGRLDGYAGDGDHGQGMARGSSAAAAAAQDADARAAGAPELLAAAGAAWADRAGGTSGALWGLALNAAAGALDPERADAAGCARAALDAVQRAGGARAGDKTLVDALLPFVEALEATRDQPLAGAWRTAADAADRAAQATSELTPRLGRARPLAGRSVGHPDPGAVSLALVVSTVADQLSAATGGEDAS
jgi:dihydroxyacetone kinase